MRENNKEGQKTEKEETLPGSVCIQLIGRRDVKVCGLLTVTQRR